MPTTLEQLAAQNGLLDVTQTLDAVAELPPDTAQDLLSIIADTSYSWSLASVAGIGCWTTSAKAASATTDGSPVGWLSNLVNPTKSFRQATDAQRPRLATGANGINGLPALVFGPNLSLVMGTAGHIVDGMDTGYTCYLLTEDPLVSTIGVWVGTGNGANQFYLGQTGSSATITAYHENGTTDTYTSALANSTTFFQEPVGVHTVQVSAVAGGAIGISIYRNNVLVMQDATTDEAAAALNIAGGTLALGNFSNNATLYTRSKIGAILIAPGQHTAAQRAAVNKALNAYYRVTNPCLVVVGDSNWSGYGLSGSGDSIEGGSSPFGIVNQALGANKPPAFSTLSGVVTYDATSLDDGVGETTTVSVWGAALGDTAVAALGVSTAGITVTANVTAANTVSVRVQNESGGTLDLASTDLHVTVIKREPASHNQGWTTRAWAIAGEVLTTYTTVGALTITTTSSTTNLWARRIAHYGAAGARPISICYIALGQNDYAQAPGIGNEAATVWARLLSLINTAKQTFTHVIVQPFLPRSTASSKIRSIGYTLNSIIAQNAASVGYTVVNTARTELLDNTSDTYFQSDDIHVTQLGALALADAAIDAIKTSQGVS